MSAGVYKGLTVKFGADTHDLSAALNEIDSRTGKLRSNLRKATNALKLDPKNTELVGQKFKYLGEQVTAAEDKLKELKAAESQIGKQGMSTEAWDTLQREISATEAKLKQAKEAARQFAVEQASANSALGKAGAALSAAGAALEPVGQKMQSLGRGMTTHVTLPLAAAGAATVKVATDIDSALTGVRKTVDATAEEYEALKDAAIEYSKTSAVSATDILNAEELGGQLGVAKENLEAFARVATGLDISTNMNVESASTNMARFMNVTQASADATKSATEQYEAYGNAVVGLGNNLATTESEISDFSLRMASAASLAGMSQADILGIGGAMSSLGLQAEAGGTAFSNTITEISMAVSSGGEMLEGFAKVAGKSADEFAEKWRVDATGAFVDFITGLARGREAGEDMNLVLDQLGITGIRQSDAMRRLAGNTSLLTDAIALANEEWRGGAALANEVGNRNESLASKFEMLRHRLVAVADEIGEPLADALMQAVDAAEPLFEAIEGGARAFSEMSDGEQAAVVQTVALIAALGPMMSVAGKLMGNVKVAGGALQALATWFARVDVATGGAKDGLVKVTDAAGKTTTQVSKASVALGALKAGAIAAAVGGVALLAGAVADYYKKQDEYTSATRRLVGAVDLLDGNMTTVAGAARDASGAFGQQAKAVRDYGAEVDELGAKQAALSKEIRDSISDTASTNGALQIYADKIAELAGNCEDSEERLAELKIALDGYNSIAGTAYEVTDQVTGAISASTAELANNTEAWKANAEAAALQSALTGIYEERVGLEQELADAKAAHEAEQRSLNDAMAAGEPISQAQLSSAAAAERAYEKAKGLLDANYEAEGRLLDRKKESAAAYELATASIDDYRTALEAAGKGGDGLEAAAEAAGKSVDGLVEELKAAKVSARDFATLGASEFARLYQEADGDLSKVAEAVRAVDALKIDPKDVHVTDNGEIADAKGRIIDLDNQKIDGKSFSVTAIDYASSVIDRVRDKLAELPGEAQVKVTAAVEAASSFFRRASGGISPAPIRIPRHADGGLAGIATRAQLTNVGWVGEDGAEAIVPLTNRRYVRPFAEAVASAIDLSPLSDSNDAVLAELKSLHSDVAQLEVKMDSKTVGALTAPHVDAALGRRSTARKRGI